MSLEQEFWETHDCTKMPVFKELEAELEQLRTTVQQLRTTVQEAFDRAVAEHIARLKLEAGA